MECKMFDLPTALILLSTLSIAWSMPSEMLPSKILPEIRFSDLLAFDAPSSIVTVHALTNLGALQITGIPDFNRAREQALSALSSCLASDGQKSETFMMDGSHRLSAVASSSNGKAGPMSSSCGAASSKLRGLVSAATRQLFATLDLAAMGSGAGGSVLGPYDTFEDVIRHGDHLEHLHAYYSASTAPSLSTLSFHTDAGLFIAMTTGLYSVGGRSNGLFLQAASGERFRVEASEDALIIMVGEGGSRWLSPVLGVPLRAVPHALEADLPAGSDATRAWYGKMYLPPPDAMVDPSSGLRYKDYRERGMAVSAQAAREGKVVDETRALPAACGEPSNPFQHRLALQADATCGEDELRCWMRCMPLAGLECGAGAQCTDPSSMEPVDGNKMCTKCLPMCPLPSEAPSPYPSLFRTEPTPANTSPISNTPNEGSASSDHVQSPSSRSFCSGSGTDMYMNGFVSVLVAGAGNFDCVNLFFESFTLNTGWKMLAGCLGVFALGIAVQALTHARSVLGKAPRGRGVEAAIVSLYGVQTLLSYLLMLATMTYNVELFLSACLGLTVGYGWLNLRLPTPVNTDACCAADNDVDALDAMAEEELHGSEGMISMQTVSGSREQLGLGVGSAGGGHGNYLAVEVQGEDAVAHSCCSEEKKFA